MNASIADLLNRRFAAVFAEHLDTIDVEVRASLPNNKLISWHQPPMLSEALLKEDENAKWLIVAITEGSPDLDVDRVPADADWENLFTHLRAEIESRRARDTDSSSRRANESVAGMV